MIHSYEFCVQATGDIGVVEEVNGFLVKVSDLKCGVIGEGVTFETGDHGRIMTLGRTSTEILVLSRNILAPGTKCSRTGKQLTVSCGEGLLGEVINGLGYMLSDKKNPSHESENRPIEIAPADITKRTPVENFLETGIAAIDLVVPIGKGQRELVIGDRTTGKTHALMQMVTMQAKLGTICIWAAIGKRKSDIKGVEAFLKANGALKNTLIVATDSYAAPGEIYLTPYTAMTYAEYFRDHGRDVLIVLDDLTTHAKYYREISLLSGQFPGRESYPGDIFHIHSKLLERAGSFDIHKKSVTITCLPVAENSNGDMVGYIQTNLMSMTDGHLYFDSDMYFRGIRPALNVFLSVTRVGRQTQPPLLRDVGKSALSTLKKYEKAQTFLRFGPDISPELQEVIKLGDNITKFLDQTGSWSMTSTLAVVLFTLITIHDWDGTDGARIAKRYDKDATYRAAIHALLHKATSMADLVTAIQKDNTIII
jgi:F-type H+-transporting ATPase subunit alpha